MDGGKEARSMEAGRTGSPAGCGFWRPDARSFGQCTQGLVFNNRIGGDTHAHTGSRKVV